MKRLWLLLALTVILLLAACRQIDSALGPTPAPTIAGPPIQAAAVPLLTLIRNPGGFQGSYVQVSGDYEPKPLLVCSGESHRPPATWSLKAGELEIRAGGFDSALRSLAERGTPLTVEGRWQHFHGPVGCGRRPAVQEFYYLEVARIVSPNPLSQLAAADRGEVAEAPTEAPSPEEGEAVELMPTVTGVAAVTAGPPSPPPAATTPAGPPSPGLAGTATPTATGTFDVSPTIETIMGTLTQTTTPTSTLALSPTPVSAGAPTATPVSVGSISFESNSNLVKREISAGALHQWQFVGSGGTFATISVAASPDLDLSLEVVGPDGASLQLEDQEGTGGVETIDGLELEDTGTHFIRVRALNSSSGAYALVLLDSDSEPFYVFQGNITYSGTGSGNLPASVDHLYNFMGSAGDRITITVSGVGSSDMVIYLLGPDGSELAFVDNNGPGAQEQLAGFLLTASGYYSIGTGDANFEPATYTMTLARGS
jgi:hypothetical protein